MENISPLFVLVLGMVTVFFGLICLIVLTNIMSSALKGKKVEQEASPAAAVKAAPVVQNDCPIADRKLFDAVVAATIATYMGNAPEGLRIRSIKKV